MMFVLTGCNHLFYFPDRDMRLTPDQIGHTYEEFTVVTADDIKLTAWLLRADETIMKPWGTVLHFHGNAENMSTHMAFSHWLTRHGFNVVTFDYRGYGQSEGTPDREGLVRDGEAMINALRARDDLREQDLFIFAQSLGGAVAIPALAEAGEQRIRALVIESSFASYRTVARRKLGDIWLTWLFQYPLSFLVSDNWSPEDHIERLSLPMLFVHGDEDPVVDIESGRDLVNVAGPRAKEFWELPQKGHTPAFIREQSPLRPKLVTFLCTHSSHPERCKKLMR